MTATTDASARDRTKSERDATRFTVRNQHDFGDLLVAAQPSVPAEIGSTDSLVSVRPGWPCRRHIVKGTIGCDNDYVSNYTRRLP